MRIHAIVLSLASAAVCGCTGVSPLLTQVPDRDVDAAKVASIDRVAQAHNVEVHWVHYPRRKDAATASSTETPTPAGT